MLTSRSISSSHVIWSLAMSGLTSQQKAWNGKKVNLLAGIRKVDATFVVGEMKTATGDHIQVLLVASPVSLFINNPMEFAIGRTRFTSEVSAAPNRLVGSIDKPAGTQLYRVLKVPNMTVEIKDAGGRKKRTAGQARTLRQQVRR